MKLYYITDKATHLAGHRFFKSSHYQDLSNGKIVLMAEFDDKTAEELEAAWRAHPGVIPLPSPNSNRTVGKAIAGLLTEHDVLETDSTYDVSEKLASKNRGLRIL